VVYFDESPPHDRVSKKLAQAKNQSTLDPCGYVKLFKLLRKDRRTVRSDMNPRHKIAYLLTPIEFGGSEKVGLNFLRNVDRSAYEIHPILFFRPWEGDTFFLEEIKKENFSPRGIPVSLGKHDYLWLLRRFGKLFSYLRQGHFDLLHTHGYVGDILGIASARLLKIPVISTCHGFIESDRKLSIYNRLDRFFLKFADQIIAVSTDICSILISGGIGANHIKVIPNAVETGVDEASFLSYRRKMRSSFSLSEADFVLGYVGRLSEEKGIQYLIEAVSLARNESCPVKLMIIGDGPQNFELQAIVGQRRLAPYVIFTGFQNNVEQFLPAMDVFVLPSLTEGTPIALLEAMAYGIPSIASAVGQIPEIIHSGKSGILVTPGSANEIFEAILFLHNSPSVRKTISQAARKIVEDQFDIGAWVKRIEAEYIRLIEKYRDS
jgi:glycosyltransferase involved in cell wall biosynthesis